MPQPEDLAADFPPPLEGEPQHLRRDIVDELSDHLHCAMQRELRVTDDPHGARQAVLQRFGNPARIARTLWLDAMKEQLMNQRIMLGTLIVMAVAVITACVVMIISLQQSHRMQQAMMQAQEGLIARLEATAAASPSSDMAAAAAAYNWPTLDVQVLQPDGASGMANQQITLSGEPYSPGKAEALTARTDEQGLTTFGPMRPGIYTLNVNRPEGWHRRNVTVRPGENTPLLIQWHEAGTQQVPVELRMEFPQDIQERKVLTLLTMSVRPNSTVDEPGVWQWGNVHVAFNHMGQIALVPTTVVDKSFNIDPAFQDSLEWSDAVHLNPDLQYIPTGMRVWYMTSPPDGEPTYTQLASSVQVQPRSFAISGTPGEVIQLQPDVSLQELIEFQMQRSPRSQPRPSPR